ncbi:MAG: hypothetical protein NT013_30385, partial [Planctomycetia bacterium]|nr:hypothetical protein [Planctomycetia bacterium]
TAVSSQTVLFTAGATSRTVTVSTMADSKAEANETFAASLAGLVDGGRSVTISSVNGSATGTISNDDLPPNVTLSVSPVTLSEAAGTAAGTVTATLSAVSSFDVTVNLGFSGTATQISDYARSGTQIVIVAGNTSGTITLTAVQEALIEADESIIVDIVDVTNGLESGTQQVSATILDDDRTDVSVTVSPMSVLEDGAANLVYTFTRTGGTNAAMTVNFTVGGTATLTTDYAQTGAATFTASTGSLSFLAGQTSKTITLNPATDTTIEADETVVLTLTVTPTSAYAAGSANTATGIITNDDFPRITLAVSPASVAESGTANSVFTFTRTGPTTSPLSVDFTVGGSATLDTDYSSSGASTLTTSTGSVTFAAGQATKTVTIDPTDDTVLEANETVLLVLATGNGYVVGTTTAVTATITNDDQEVSVTVSADPVTEDGVANLVYTFTRSGATSAALTASFTVTGTAALGTDYAQSGAATFTSSSGTVSFTAGQTTKAVTINPTADTTIELDELVVLTLTSATTYSVGADGTATGIIVNDDPRVSVAVTPSAVTENGATNATYTFTRTGSTASALTVNFDVSGTAELGTDYVASGATSFNETSGTVTFGVGQATKTVMIDPTPDSVVEPNETVVLTVNEGSNYVVGSPTAATATITNDDAEISVTAAPTSVAEDGTPNLVYTFTRVGATSAALTANFTISGTATPVVTSTSAVDYAQTGAATFNVTTGGTISFPAGQTTVVVTINPTADTVIESDETVVLTLTPTTTYSVGTANTATGTIANDDPRVTLAVTPASVAENGTANSVYTFTRTGATTSALTVNFDVSGTATFNTDYIVTGATSFAASGGVVTFAANSSTTKITIDPTGDTTFESNETVALSIAAASSYVVGTLTPITTTINNDDTEVTVALSTTSVDENETPNLLYTFTRNGLMTSALTVTFTVAGTATFSSDYTQTGAATFNATTRIGTVSIAAGQTTKVVTINPTGDTASEPDETVILTVGSSSAYSVGSPDSATGIIKNDDAAASLLASQPVALPRSTPQIVVVPAKSKILFDAFSDDFDKILSELP